MFTEILGGSPHFQNVIKCLEREKDTPLFVAGVGNVARAMLCSFTAEKTKAPVLVITPDEAQANRMATDLRLLMGKAKVELLPAREVSFRGGEASAEFEHKRLGVLGKLLSGQCQMVVCSVESALQYTTPPGTYKYNTLSVSRGESVPMEKLTALLVRAGYEYRPEVTGAGQFSQRGGILDFFAPKDEFPTRIEFWGDEVDSIAFFDIDSQRRTTEQEEATISPAKEIMWNSDKILIETIKEAMAKVHGKNAPKIKMHLNEDIKRIEAGLAPLSHQKLLPLCYKYPATVFDYMPGATIFISDFIKHKETIKALNAQWREDLAILFEEGILFPGCCEYSMSDEEYFTTLSESKTVLCDTFLRTVAELPIRGVVDFESRTRAPWSGELSTLLEDIEELRHEGYRIGILAGTERGAHSLTADLIKEGLPAAFCEDMKTEKGTLSVMEGFLTGGAEFPAERIAILTHSPTGGSMTRKRKVKKAEDPLKSLSDLTVGDAVVHVYHGIGIFDGIVKRDIHGIVKDYIAIRYAGTDMLFVPVTQLDMVSKYIGNSEDKPIKLSKLNSVDWSKTRSRVKAAVKEMAKELIAIYAKRLSAKGFAFSEDSEWQKDFEERFPYEETEDQLRSTEEIKRDMEAPRPMDRLLCGDVGFGKTEVALRAAFKCIMDSKQVALLVPTTILAAQHYQTFVQRFEGFPVSIELLSRFRSTKEQEKIIKKLSTGEVDIVVGTHKLLQKNIKFKDLGLCIIDEEQRFGVAHKERFKELKSSVDVLTLSATPIPRTLNMAMSGIRDMSTIEEAPGDRVPVETYVTEYDRGLVLEAIRRELRRDGQVFYLHNRVESIATCAAKLQNDLPDAKIVYAHGKMSEEELSSVWQSLIDHEADILVSTTIIESGVDVPNCNTLIIEDADKLGLAQLYQLRGRVGRSSRRAYAYFTFTRGKSISDVAEKRLNAIRDFTQFGSGIKIAMRDLEIRGAGNILGASQHGHMESVGYEMYLRLLSEAVAEEKGEAPPVEADCAVDIRTDAHIPEKYITSLSARVDVYKRIAAIRSEEDARDVVDELCDRFGEPPAAVLGLTQVALLRNTAAALGITEIRQNDHEMRFYLKAPELERVSKATGIFRGRLAFCVGEKSCLALTLKIGEKPMEMMKKVLNAYS